MEEQVHTTETSAGLFDVDLTLMPPTDYPYVFYAVVNHAGDLSFCVAPVFYRDLAEIKRRGHKVIKPIEYLEIKELNGHCPKRINIWIKENSKQDQWICKGGYVFFKKEWMNNDRSLIPSIQQN